MKYLFNKSISLHIFIVLTMLLTGQIGADSMHSSVSRQEMSSLGPHFHREDKPKPIFKSSPPHIQANAYLLIDANSGKILASHNANERVAPASLTKMMTSYLISSALHSGRLDLEEPVVVSRKAGKTGGSRMFISPGSRVKVQDLLQGVIVHSGNDASIALAEHVAGSEEAFAEIMNQQASRLGMKGTHFSNVSGLPYPEHYTTALDMATLARAIILDFPQHYHWYSQKFFTYAGIKQSNRNRLLWRGIGVDGIKTGDTNEAGYCLVASAKQGDMRLIAVIMGAPSEQARTQGTQALLNYGFHFFETHKMYSATQPIEKPKVWLGSRSRVNVSTEYDVYVTVQRGLGQYLKKKVILHKPLKAPLAKKAEVGQVQICVDDEIISTTPLVTLEAVSWGSWWRRVLDRIGLFFLRKWY
jgi:D-alanyl-D-alanine carboxypeptidase (penicillin-binding protein 5/6)